MNLVTWLLLLHGGLAALTIVLFVWRGVRMWKQQPVTSRVARRLLPDTVDTLLLISGITLVLILDFVPWQDAWLAAKLLAVFLYIILGFIALDRVGKSQMIKRSSFVISLLLLCYIVSVAHTMQAMPWL